MNRRKTTIFAVTITLLLVGAVFSSFALSGWLNGNPPSIELPPKPEYTATPTGNVPNPKISFAPYKPLGLDVSSAKETIATLHRPTSYLCDISVTQYWQDGQSTCNYRLAVRGSSFSVQESCPGQEPRAYWSDGTQFCSWVPGREYVYRGMLGAASADNLCAVPTYEDLLKLPDGTITKIGYQSSEDGAVYLEVYTRDDLYIGQYLLDVETGLLRRAEFHDVNTEEDTIAYLMTMNNYQAGDPGSALLTPPNS